MILLGILLLLIAVLVPQAAALWGVGIVVIIIGLILAILDHGGHQVGGRRWY